MEIKPLTAKPGRTMKTLTRTVKPARMSADAYAGFLKLLLTPSTREPSPSAEVDAYLRYANERSPLPANLSLPTRRPTNRAA
jgi:hypothetical protein